MARAVPHTDLLAKAVSAPADLDPSDWADLLAADGPAERGALHAAAYAKKRMTVGAVIRPRGLIEFSNECVRNCLYCGIRRAARPPRRYTMSPAEVAAAAGAARDAGWRSVVLQSGERRDEAFVVLVADILAAVHAATDGALTVTLSAGEQSADTYARWRAAGAHRYLLRIETSDRDLYRALHPDEPGLDARDACLGRLRDAGFQVGSGVLIGVPGQTFGQLAADLVYLRDKDVDMIGMGPFIPHAGTPLASAAFAPERQLDLGLAMIACARLLLPDANIAAATALEALVPDGRRRGLLAGANVVMPNHTPAPYRAAYDLYRRRPAAGDAPADLDALADTIGETVDRAGPGDAPRWLRRPGPSSPA